MLTNSIITINYFIKMAVKRHNLAQCNRYKQKKDIFYYLNERTHILNDKRAF